MGIVTSFQNILDNVFIPLFEVTVDPNSHPQLHLFLMQVSHFFSYLLAHPTLVCVYMYLVVWLPNFSNVAFNNYVFPGVTLCHWYMKPSILLYKKQKGEF